MIRTSFLSPLLLLPCESICFFDLVAIRGVNMGIVVFACEKGVLLFWLFYLSIHGLVRKRVSLCFLEWVIFLQVLPGRKRNIGCFYLVCRSLGKVIGVESLAVMLYQGLLLKWPAMLRNISLGNPMFLGEKDVQACLIL